MLTKREIGIRKLQAAPLNESLIGNGWRLGNSLSRRRTLQIAIGGAMAGLGVVLTRSALAQRGDLSLFDRVVKEMKPHSERLSTNVRKTTTKGPVPLPSLQQVSFAVADYGQRLRLAVAARGLGNDDLRKLVHPDMTPWANEFIERKVRLVAAEAEISPIPIGKDKEQVPQFAKADRIDIVADILLDALDLLEAKNMLKEVVRKLPGFEERAEDISKALKNGRADLVVDGLINLIEHVFQAKAASLLLKQLGEAQRRKVLAALGARFVPVFGWVYFGVAVVLSANRHWERLRAA